MDCYSDWLGDSQRRVYAIGFGRLGVTQIVAGQMVFGEIDTPTATIAAITQHGLSIFTTTNYPLPFYAPWLSVCPRIC